jgi:hypothetical protein
MARKQRNLLNIGQLGVWREIANLHILAHPFSEIGKYEMSVGIIEEKLVLLEYREAV